MGKLERIWRNSSRNKGCEKGDPIFPRLEMEEEVELILKENARNCT